jgi:hypothetical protein
MPPLISARRPRSTMGRPACKVAARSMPPSNRPSEIAGGSFRNGVEDGNKLRRFRIQSSRTGPALPRTQTPQVPMGSTANKAAAAAPSDHIVAPELMQQSTRQARVRPEHSSPNRPEDCGEGDVAGTPAIPASMVRIDRLCTFDRRDRTRGTHQRQLAASPSVPSAMQSSAALVSI